MPKKRQPRSLYTKPSTTAPASLAPASTPSSSTQHGASSAGSTVNELIRRLRVSQFSHESTPPRPPTMSTVHHSLRSLLSIPGTPPPQAQPGGRPQAPTRVRRIPGPPPPESWLASKHAPEDAQGQCCIPRRLQHRTIKLPEAWIPEERSLQHMLLKTMALNWQWHAEFDKEHLRVLPTRIKQTLLSYIAIYLDISVNALRLLFPSPNDASDDITQEADEVRRLDLTNALGRWLSMKRLSKTLILRQSLEAPQHVVAPVPASFAIIPHEQSLTPGSVEDDNRHPNPEYEIPESWDNGQTEVPNIESSGELRELFPSISRHLVSSRGGCRFRNLRHLSLALDPALSCPSFVGSWSSLLSLSSHLSTLSSLSLAFWPPPTYTPVAAASWTRIETQTSRSMPAPVYGGTNMYSVLDNDWREASGILNTLSTRLYCLKWLDLTGCIEWAPALIWHSDGMEIDHSGESSSFGGLNPLRVSPGPEWNGSWRSVEWLGLGVGWLPGKGDLKQERQQQELKRRAVEIGTHIERLRISARAKKIVIEYT